MQYIVVNANNQVGIQLITKNANSETFINSIFLITYNSNFLDS